MVGSADYTDVFIVGGGPAGLATAIAARQKGLSVTVADGAAPPIDKPCGEGLMPATLDCLSALGVKVAPTDGYRFKGVRFAQDDSQVSATFPEGVGLGLSRPVLHERMMARAQECGVNLWWNTPVIGIEGNTIRHSRGELRARWIVGADGQGSRLRRWSGLDQPTRYKRRQAVRRHYRVPPWTPYMEVHWGRHSQTYLTPIGQQVVCVAIVGGRGVRVTFDDAIDEVHELRHRLAGAEITSRERGAITVMRSLHHVQRGNFALVGDASGGVDAITGEGLCLAFQQAFALADAMTAGDLLPYERAHRRIVNRPMIMGELMLWLARNPGIRKRVLRAMEDKPELFARFLAVHVGKGDAASALATGVQLGLRLLRA